MTNQKQGLMGAEAWYERAIHEEAKLRRNQEEREERMESKNFLSEQNAGGLNEKKGEDETRDMYREMEDWYREEKNHSTAKAA